MHLDFSPLEVKLYSSTQEPLKTMWLAARNCYFRGGFQELEKQFDPKKAPTFLKSIYDKGHLSIFEFPSFTFQIQNISRSCLAQMTRHRIGVSFAVQSQHYQTHDNFTFKELEQYVDEAHCDEYHKLMAQINDFYIRTRNAGVPKYIAREVLPNSCHVHLMFSANLRALDNFWKLRSSANNTPEIRKLSEKLYQETTIGIPELPEIIKYGK